MTSNTGERCRPHHGYLSCSHSSEDFGRNCGLHYPLGQFIRLSIDRLSFPLQGGTRLSCPFSVVFEVGLPFLHKCGHSFSPVILDGKGRRGVKSASSYWAPWMTAACSPRFSYVLLLGGLILQWAPLQPMKDGILHTVLCLGTAGVYHTGHSPSGAMTLMSIAPLD